MAEMDELMAYAIFGVYFGLIFFALGFVIRSIGHGIALERLADQKPFLFIRLAVVALFSTWYYMYEYMKWSYRQCTVLHPGATFGQWLQNTRLFEQAWTIVSETPGRWFISSGICTWTVIFTLIVWAESSKRGIKHPWAYMLLGQLVAISFSTALFVTALTLRSRTRQITAGRVWLLLIPLFAAMVTIYRNPLVVKTDKFMPNLLTLHGLLLLPLFVPPKTVPVHTPGATPQFGSNIAEWAGYIGLSAAALTIHKINFDTYITTTRPKAIFSSLYRTMIGHPAQGSISFDVVFALVTLFFWLLTTGSWTSLFLKSSLLLATISGIWISKTGVNWTLVASIIPVVLLASIGILTFALGRLRKNNEVKRKALLNKMGIVEETVVPGTDRAPPSFAPRRIVVGFWHPYCNAGGGGERVLWTAIAHIQKAHPDVVSLVYSGDYPVASQEAILAKINERFSIKLNPKTLQFISLPSRYIVDDTYWKHFTLLGQSLGSLYLAWEGLCGKEGLWGDIFMDTMGYAFTYPFVRFLTGGECVIGAYTHYPTVSADMVKRVNERTVGIESGMKQSSNLRRIVKLIYYRCFTLVYAVCLLFSEYIMGNSSWTHAHLVSLITKARTSLLASLFLLDDTSLERNKLERAKCEVVYPPCDTAALTDFPLTGRKNEIVSLAQFRPEKEHWKQVEALAALFKHKPELRGTVRLVMMGGARHPKDEARVEDLKAMAVKLGVRDSIEFVVNAPYGDVVARLGKATLGLNTMQDEHFGINIVEFMAAGLIPIVHASAGPYMDIVVPYKGQQTGFHAKTPEDFAIAIENALSLSPDQAKKMRQAARNLAIDKFSEARFNEAWERGWKVLVRKVSERRRPQDTGR